MLHSRNKNVIRIVVGVVFSLVHYFTVSLGDRWSDLRISYDIPKNKSVSSDRNLVYNITF